jgi:hypothetical protein
MIFAHGLMRKSEKIGLQLPSGCGVLCLTLSLNKGGTAVDLAFKRPTTTPKRKIPD